MTRPKDPDCDARHNRLLGLVVLIVLAICGATMTYAKIRVDTLERDTRTRVDALDSAADLRLRSLEIESGANAERFVRIMEAVERLEDGRR